MNTCPFCKGPALTQHTAQECLAHVRQRLREMTERRDALQISLDNQRRIVEQKAQRIQQVTRERDEARKEARKAAVAIERERAVRLRAARILEVKS